MCSKVPFHFDRQYLIPFSAPSYVEESEDQRVYVDGLTTGDVVQLLNFIFDLENYVLKPAGASKPAAADSSSTAMSSSGNAILPHTLLFIHQMSDPLESGLLDSYYNYPAQCATCALRFESRKILTSHHDYHFARFTILQRRRRKLDYCFRGWMDNPNEFLDLTDGTVLSSNIYNRKMNNPKSLQFLITNTNSNIITTTKTSATASNTDIPITASVSADASTDEDDHDIPPLSCSSSSLLCWCPVDEVKSLCLECGEAFETEYISEPIGTSVYIDCVCIPVITNNITDNVKPPSKPIKFIWPGGIITPPPTSDRQLSAPTTAAATCIDAITAALSDPRVVNSIYIHYSCYKRNKKLQDDVDYQRSLVTLLTQDNQDSEDELCLLEREGGEVEVGDAARHDTEMEQDNGAADQQQLLIEEAMSTDEEDNM